MQKLAEVWSGITPLLKDHVSLIPVRDRNTQYNGATFPAKTPYAGWKKYQQEVINEGDLYAAMEKHNTSAIAMICGAVSNNLEVIDIDVKYKAGIDASLFHSISNIYPDLYEKLRIHKTPSGGYHILYRIALGNIVPGNVKLAGRNKTEEERIAQPKGDTVNFIETRGEGGYVLAPPSLNYQIHKDNPIPVLTWEERCSLITLCQSFSEIVKLAPKPKAERNSTAYYSANPFEDFDNRAEPIELMEQFGWFVDSENSEHLYFTRPGKDAGVSATWIKALRVFYIFTSSTELEPSTGYLPATILTKLMFNGDNKAANRHLKQNGYGVVFDFVEDREIRKALINNDPLPANFSKRAKDLHEELKKEFNSNLPYGVFWQVHITKPGEYNINREHFYKTLELMGFRRSLNNELLYRIEDKRIVAHDLTSLYKAAKAYIWDENERVRNAVWNTLDKFQQGSGDFSIKQLPVIDREAIISDTAYEAYKFYQNGVLHITATEHTLIPYSAVEGLIWSSKIQPRNWVPEAPEFNLFQKFVENAVGLSDYVQKVIGYLAHDFRSEASGYVIVFTEKTLNPKDGGGTGKNVLGNMLRGTTTVRTVQGSAVDFNDKFLSSWSDERIYFLADIPKLVDWPFLKEIATGTGLVNKKYVAVYNVDPGDMPKILVNTNYSFDNIDGGVKRRIKAIEFENYYGIKGGVDVVHGKMFPDDFTADDWAGYDHFIMQCLQQLFKAKGKLEHHELSYEGWLKKFYMNNGDHAFDFIDDYMPKWLEARETPLGEFNADYHEFCHANGIVEKYRKGSTKMNDALREYCEKYLIFYDFENKMADPSGSGRRIRCKKFSKKEIVNEEDIY